jgi:hypothetical protein
VADSDWREGDPGPEFWCGQLETGPEAAVISPQPRSFRLLRLSSRRYAQTSSCVSSASHHRGSLLVDLHVEPEVSCLFPRYYYEDSSSVTLGDHVPLHQHSDAKLVARMEAYYVRISAKILLDINYSLLGKQL